MIASVHCSQEANALVRRRSPRGPPPEDTPSPSESYRPFAMLSGFPGLRRLRRRTIRIRTSSSIAGL